MKFWEAMKALQEGKRVRMKEWDAGSCWSFKSPSSIYATIIDIFQMSAKEWEIYEEPEETLSFSEAVKGLKEGKRFKRKEWFNSSIYLSLLGDLVVCSGLDSEKYCPCLSDFEATDWVEVR